MKRKMEIRILGNVASGKSALCQEIHDHLRKKGIECRSDDEDPFRAPSMHAKILELLKGTEVVIKTKTSRKYENMPHI